MATMVGSPAGNNRSEQQGEEESLDRYTGAEDIWRKGIEKIITVIEEMRRGMRREMEKMKERLVEEGRAREEERRREKEEWMEEKRIVEERMENLEWIDERKEREAGRNEIVAKGVKWEKERIEQEVAEFVEKIIKVFEFEFLIFFFYF